MADSGEAPTIEDRCRALLAGLAPRVEPRVLEEPRALLEAGEWGLAFEQACDSLYDLGVGVLPEEVREIESLGRALQSSRRSWRRLHELVTDPAPPLTVDALRSRLRRTSVPRDAYRVAEGDADEAWVLDHEASRWVVYYSERGLRTGEVTFTSEADACADLLERLRSAFDA